MCFLVYLLRGELCVIGVKFNIIIMMYHAFICCKNNIQGFISMDMYVLNLADDMCTCRVILQQFSIKRFLIFSKFWHCDICFDPRSALALSSIGSPYPSCGDAFLDEVPGLGTVNLDFQQLVVVMTALMCAIRLNLRIGCLFTHIFCYCGNKNSK